VIKNIGVAAIALGVNYVMNVLKPLSHIFNNLFKTIQFELIMKREDFKPKCLVI
jgi:hypothetical protein